MPCLISPRFHARIGRLMVAAVVVLSLVPAAPLPEITAGYDDKLAHGLIYSVLMAWFAVIAARPDWTDLGIRLFALGAALESCQALLPYRSASFADIYANTSGILLGTIVAFVLTTGPGGRGRAK
jgi:VanZ family protein